MTATTPNTTSSMMLSRPSTTNVWNGGVKYQFTTSTEATAALGSPTADPPTAATTTTVADRAAGRCRG